MSRAAADHEAGPISQLPDGGYDEDWEDASLAAKWDCMICHLVSREAVAPSCCGELFCEVCWVKCQQREAKCPHCREGTRSADAANKDRKEIRNLRLNCPQGCGSVVILCRKDQHLNEDCSERTVSCAACNASVVARHMDAHKSSECSANFQTCRLCGESVPKNGMAAHLDANIGQHMVSMMSLLGELDDLREKVKELDGLRERVKELERMRHDPSSQQSAQPSVAAPPASEMWHPGLIKPFPNGIERMDGGEIRFEPGYAYDAYATGWCVRNSSLAGLPTLDVVFPKDAELFGDRVARWTCCDGYHDAPPCRAKLVVASNMWHPGRIRPQPLGINRVDGSDCRFDTGWSYDEFATGWDTSLSRVFCKDSRLLEDGSHSRWSCCDGEYDAPPCQRRSP